MYRCIGTLAYIQQSELLLCLHWNILFHFLLFYKLKAEIIIVFLKIFFRYRESFVI